MIKVVHVINQAEEGGGLEHVLSLLNELKGSNFEFFTATSGPDYMLERIERAGSRVIPVELMGSRMSPVPSIKLVRLVKQLGADILHLHGTRAAFFGMPARMMSSVKSVYTVHVLSYHKLGSRNGLTSIPYMWAERVCCGVHDRVIAISQSYTNELLKHEMCRVDKLATIPNGVNYNRLRHVDKVEAQRALGLDARKSWAGVAARLAPQKGLEYLIDAARILKERGLEVGVAIAGAGELKGRLESLARAYGLEDTVVFCGHQRDIARFLSAIDVFVLPSLWEGLPLTLLEAMAMGLVCIATDLDGVKEAIEHGRTGILVPPRDSDALADAMQSALSDLKKFAPLGEAAKRDVKRFSWKESAARTAGIYKELVEG